MEYIGILAFLIIIIHMEIPDDIKKLKRRGDNDLGLINLSEQIVKV
ncbi:hypothetical protein [Natronospora cellulosivora (SeqCode)]